VWSSDVTFEVSKKETSMSKQPPEEVEKEFFDSLMSADVENLVRVLAGEFVLIDVMTGSEISGQDLVEVVRSAQLRFETIDRTEFKVRTYGTTAVITGRTEMSGWYEGQEFRVTSRYTHFLVQQRETWRMVSAQGTQIVDRLTRESTAMLLYL
jgi:ketosteroid isomerase-like protein